MFDTDYQHTFTFGVLITLDPHIPTDAAKTIASAIVGSRLDYCNSLLTDTSAQNLSCLDVFRSFRMLLPNAHVAAQKPRYCSITLFLVDLHWPPVHQWIDLKTDTTAFKVLQYQQIFCLAEILPKYTPSRLLKSSGSTTIFALLIKTSRVSLKSFSSVASSIWNELPGHLSSVQTLPVFRKHLKHHLFPQVYHSSVLPTISAVLTSSIIPSI